MRILSRFLHYIHEGENMTVRLAPIPDSSYRWLAHHVAKALNRPVRTIRHLAQTGVLPAKKRGCKIWLFPEDPQLLLTCYLENEKRRR
jgi:hypothetical protein